VSVKNLSCPGLVYVGENLPDLSRGHNDACLINPTLRIAAAEPWQGGEEMDYWPKYDSIPARCRGAYLKWLATGRSDSKACVGYVFLFFYGLERRLFHDGMKQRISEKERAAIVGEVRRLLAVYGENRSFKGYATNLLAMERGLFQPQADIPDYLNLADSFSADPFQVQLARYAAAQKPLPAMMALQWLRFHPDFGLRTPARRCAKEFNELFARRYAEKFGDGLVVPLNQKKLSIAYRAANPSLRGLRLDFAELPDPFSLTAPLKKIFAVSESCAAELEAYSRYLGRKGSDSASLAALALLPGDLAAPAAEKIRGLLGRIAADGPGLVETKTLYEIMGQPLPAQIDKKDAENLAVLVEKLGFGLVPDVRYHGAKPDKNAQVAVFPQGHGPDFKPSREFRLVGAMLRLGALVGQSDGKVSPPEENLLKSLVHDDRELTGAEKGALLAYLHWRLYAPQETAGVKRKVSELDSDCKELVGRILISVAHADGRIDPNEVKQLEKLYPALGLDKARVAGDLHAMAGADGLAEAARLEPALTRPPQTAGPAFSLNDELIRLRERETLEVRNVLENIFNEQPEKPSPDEPQETPEENPLAGLDQPYQKLLTRLMEQEHWERPAVHEICGELRLMLDGALEVLNEWAFANANAPLIEDGDPIYVDLELAKELANA
jgi:tellurite resistance protein